MTEQLIQRERPALPRPEPIVGTIDNCDVSRRTYVFPDGKETKVTVLRPAPEAKFTLAIDPRFTQLGIKLDNKRLISQANTKKEKGWDGTVGKTPEEFISDAKAQDVVAFHPTNAGWQRDAFWVVDGRPELLANDQKEINGRFTVLGEKKGEWGIQEVSFSGGKLDQASSEALAGMNVGFDIPLMVRDGEVQPLHSYTQHSRLLADLRNVFDFGAGKKLPGKYWEDGRTLFPEEEQDAERLLVGGVIVTGNHQVLDSDAVNNLQAMIENAGIDDSLQVDGANNYARMQITQKLPLNRIPLFGIGHDEEGNLVVVTIDGRQEGSAGATLEEAAQIMKDCGIVNGGLGSAGGDVVVVGKDGKYLNSPSAGTSRPVPSVLMIK